MKVFPGLAWLMWLSALTPSVLYGQCNNLACYYSGATHCFYCVDNSGTYCGLQSGAKCSKTCVQGACDAPGLSPAQKSSCIAASDKTQATAVESNSIPLSLPKHATTTAEQCPQCVRVISMGSPESPLVFVQTSHGPDDLLEHAIVKDVSRSAVISFRVGWTLLYHDQSRPPVAATGEIVIPGDPIDPGLFYGVPSQRVSGLLATNDVSQVVFYIAEAETQDGNVFTANVSDIAARAQKGMSAIAGSSMRTGRFR